MQQLDNCTMMKCESAAQQNKDELLEFIGVLWDAKVKSYLEIGSKDGGSMWTVANALPEGARVVSVDLPHGKGETLPNLQQCIQALCARGYDAHLIIGDSTDPLIVAKVFALGPFDACLIDANHTLPYVKQDWKNYSKLCRLVAFHDINYSRPIPKGRMPIEVPQFWNVIKQDYRHAEIKYDKQDNGIGVLWL